MLPKGSRLWRRLLHLPAKFPEQRSEILWGNDQHTPILRALAQIILHAAQETVRQFRLDCRQRLRVKQGKEEGIRQMQGLGDKGAKILLALFVEFFRVPLNSGLDYGAAPAEQGPHVGAPLALALEAEHHRNRGPGDLARDE